MSSNSKELVYDPVSCTFTAGKPIHQEIREIYTSLVMKTSLHQEQFIIPVAIITFPVTEGSVDRERLSLRGGLLVLPSLYQMWLIAQYTGQCSCLICPCKAWVYVLNSTSHKQVADMDHKRQIFHGIQLSVSMQFS